MIVKSLDELLKPENHKSYRRIAIAAASDNHVLEAVKKAFELKLVFPVLIGDQNQIIEISATIGLKSGDFEVINEPDPEKACIQAVKLIRDGQADILMKGMVPTAVLLKAVLNKDYGLKKRDTLSHFAVFQTSFYNKLLGITDAAMNITPSLEEKVCLIDNAVEVMQMLGNPVPKVAILGPVEVVNKKIISTVHAEELTRIFSERGNNNCLVYGPLALDNAVSKISADHKKIKSSVAGNADILLVPDLDSGNILYKSLIFLSDGKAAAIITGASVPIVLTSRADSEMSKLYSIALASAL